MKKFIKLFENFDQNLNEFSKEDYTKKGYITDPAITSMDVLIKKITDEASKAIVDFAKQYNIPMKNPKITVEDISGTKYMKLEADNFTLSDETMAKVFKKMWFQLFNGRIDGLMIDGEFLFKPLIWLNLNMSWEFHSGGTNGSAFLYTDEDGGSADIWYSVLDGKFLDRKAAAEINLNRSRS